MKKSSIILIFFALLIILFFPACAEKEKKEDKDEIPVSKPRPTQTITRLTIYTDDYVHLGKPIVFRFSMSMINSGDIESEGIAPARVSISLSPHIKGEYKWTSSYELEFIPEPGAMHWGQTITATISEAVPLKGEEYRLQQTWTRRFRVKYLEVAGKVATWPVVPGYPRFIQPITSYTNEIGQGPVLLLYDQPVEAEKIKPYIRVRSSEYFMYSIYEGTGQEEGPELSFNVSKPTDLDYVFDDDEIPEEIQGLYIFDLPPNEDYVIIEVPEWHAESEDGSEVPGVNIVTFALQVNKVFEVSEVEKPGYREDIFPLKSKIDFRFNNKYSFSQMKDRIEITPEPLSYYIYQDWDGAVVFSTELNPGTDYKIYFTDAPRDVLGNVLEPFELAFRSQDLPPVMEAPLFPIVLEKGKTDFPVKVRNVENMKANVYYFEQTKDFVRALINTEKRSAREYGLRGRFETFSVDTKNLKPNVFSTIQAKIDDKPGLKCVEIIADGTGSEATGDITDAVLVQDTNVGITSKIMGDKILVWTTTLDKASIAKGAAIELFSDSGSRIGTGTTDNAGVAILDNVHMASGSGLSEPVSIVARMSYGTAVSRLVNEELSYPWQFGLPGVVEGSGQLRASVFTERGIYRPGEKVYVKVIVSLDTGKKGDRANLRIKDPRGKSIVDTRLRLDVYGAADHELRLSNQARVGEYMIQMEMGKARTIHTFKVEEYRVPAFIVTVSTEDEEWLPGESKNVLIDAEYLHGGKLGGRKVQWSVYRQYEAFSSPGFPGYKFALDTPSELNTYIARDETKLNGQGQLPVRFSTSRLDVSGVARYIVEAAVTDVDRQTYAGRLSKGVHSSDFYIGVLPPSKAVIRKGESVQVPVIAVRPDGTVVQGVKIKAYLERIDYHTTPQLTESGKVQLFNRQVPTRVTTKNIVTEQGAVTCSFDLSRAGYYRVRLTATDQKKRNVETGFIITASGDEGIAWPRFDKDQIELVFDKYYYSPGESARIVVQTPYKEATGLLTVERNSILDYKSFEIKGNTPMIPLTIKGDFAPNAFVSVVLVRGRIHYKTDATGFETGAPGFKIGYKKIWVELKEQSLTVKAEPQRRYVQPGDRVGIDVSLSDYQGKPAPGQVTLMVVDEAVLSLTNHKTPDPLAGLYIDYPLGVRTGTLYLDLPHSRRSRQETMFPGGGFGDDWDISTGFPISLRKLFESTVYWNPDIRVGTSGKTSVEVTLPDNITSYRIMAVASDLLTRAGSGEDKIVSQKPLMIQPALPRFIYPGDEFQAEVIVFNASSASGSINMQAQFKGLTVVSGSTNQTKSAAAGESTSFTFKVKALDDVQPVLRFAAKMNKHTDAAEYNLPLLEPGTEQVIVKSTPVSKSETMTLDIPAERVEGTVNLECVASSTALSELKDSVQYLMKYPNGCIEQTTSTAYPLVVLGDLLPDIGVEVDMAQLKEFCEAGVKRLLTFQTPSGGLSYWPGENQPHAFGTAFGLMALIEAKNKGYDVPDEALSGAANYLESVLRKSAISDEMSDSSVADADTMALFVMTLGRLGRPQASYISTLWRHKDSLSAFGLSFLAIAVKEMGGEKALLENILAEIRNRAEVTGDEAYFTGKPKGGWSLDSPIRSHGTSLGAYALSSDDDDITGKLLKGLLNRRSGGLWGNTQENVFGIMGVHQVAIQKTGGKAPGITLEVNGKRYTTNDMERLSTRIYRLSFIESDLKGSRVTCKLINNQPGNVYFTVRMNYEVPLIKKYMAAYTQGFTFKRTYKTMDGKSLEGKTVPLGSLVRVHLTLKTNQNLHYCAIDDKLPAGLEPVNVNLATTESLDQGQLTNEIQRGLSVLSYNEIRDHRVAFYVDEMLAHVYEFTYMARATTPGTFLRPAGRAEAMYQPEIYGTTGIDYVTIK